MGPMGLTNKVYENESCTEFTKVNSSGKNRKVFTLPLRIFPEFAQANSKVKLRRSFTPSPSPFF